MRYCLFSKKKTLPQQKDTTRCVFFSKKRHYLQKKTLPREASCVFFQKKRHYLKKKTQQGVSFFKKKTLPRKKDTPSSVFFEKKDTGGLSKRHYLDEVLSFLKKKDTTSTKKDTTSTKPR